ncbi:MAG: hypothetical protein J0I40_08410 [Cellulomonas sp.]|nr:hypothetical protein [Cellulomonas sp.]
MTGGTTSRRARRRQTGAGVLGPARVAADAVAVAARLRPGDIAVIDHLDLDRSSAEALVAAGPAAVLNAARSISGRYPNLGPQVLVDAGVPLVDDLGPDVLSVPDGHVLRVADGAVYDGQTLLAEGDLQTRESVAEAMAAARGGLATQLQAFAANGMAYLRDEQALLLEGEGVPQLRTRIEGRPVLVVVPGPKAVDDLAAVRPFVREHRPVLLGVDGGADLLLAAGLRPDIVLGALDQVSERALTGGAELVVRVPRTGETPGVARLRRLDLALVSYPAGGSAADAALLLAEARGAELVVGVGTRVGLLDLVDSGREAMAGTVLTRLRVGATLVDAGAVARLYRHRISTWQVLLLVVAALVALGVALAVTPAGQDLYAALGARLADLAGWVRGLFEGS